MPRPEESEGKQECLSQVLVVVAVAVIVKLVEVEVSVVIKVVVVAVSVVIKVVIVVGVAVLIKIVVVEVAVVVKLGGMLVPGGTTSSWRGCGRAGRAGGGWGSSYATTGGWPSPGVQDWCLGTPPWPGGG